MNTHPLLAGLQQSPDYFLQNLDLVNRRGLVVRVNRDVYRQTAFLDQRMFAADTQGAWFDLDSLLHACSGLPDGRTNYLFHIGHCGSTLLSRLLGELPGCFALREPLAFLALAMSYRELDTAVSRIDPVRWQQLFDMVLRLQARCYQTGDASLIKSTSVAGNLAQPLLTARNDARAILLCMDLETWLATMLRADETRESIRACAGAWLTDFCRQTADDSMRLHALDDVQQAVLGWTTMLLNFTRTAAGYPDRVRWVDFNAFLGDPVAHCEMLSGFLGLPASGETIASLTSSEIMGRYAKDSSQQFDSATRASELAQAQRHFAAEIRAGLHWFEHLTSRVPEFAALGPRGSGS